MPIDYQNVSYGLLKAGDTLEITGDPHYGNDGMPLVDKGAKVMVEQLYPAGCQVKTEDGKLIDLYFQHGSEKLKYTKETKDAIKSRSEFGQAKPAPKDEDKQ